MIKKNTIDYVGKDSRIIGSLRLSEEDYQFLEESSEYFFFSSLPKTIRMMIKFVKENQDQFKIFLENLRVRDKPLL